jgi:hypothetical protein
MTAEEKNLIFQACAFAREFIKEADRAAGGLESETHNAAAQLGAALQALPGAIEGCTCKCLEFNQRHLHPETNAILSYMPSFQNYVGRRR